MKRVNKMSSKDYCSKVCGARCCKAHAPIVAPAQCPSLTAENLCGIYADRIGYTFEGVQADGSNVPCVCQRVTKQYLATLEPEVRDQCYILHPEVLNAKLIHEDKNYE